MSYLDLLSAPLYLAAPGAMVASRAASAYVQAAGATTTGAPAVPLVAESETALAVAAAPGAALLASAGAIAAGAAAGPGLVVPALVGGGVGLAAVPLMGLLGRSSLKTSLGFTSPALQQNAQIMGRLSIRGGSRVAVPVMTVSVTSKADGETGTLAFRRRFYRGDDEISPWHDVPLQTGEEGVYNAVIEIPKMTKPKMEVVLDEPKNPIAQDEKKGKLRDYHGPIFWNYGMLPQTWEDPAVQHPTLNCGGDNDPVDIVEIGSEALEQGAVVSVKVLGALAMIDEGELDWKLITIRKEDPLAGDLNDIKDVEQKCPGVVSGIREWFRWYKTPDDKPLNAFGFEEAALGRKEALEIVAETNEAWKKLREKGDEKMWLK